MKKLPKDWMPRVNRISLLNVAGVVWAFAGSLLMWRGLMLIELNHGFAFLFCLPIALLFYHFVFRKIVKKHSERIITLPDERPSIFSFFDKKSYLMMALMIALGITLRKLACLPTHYLAWMYITMALPLIISSIRFFILSHSFRKTKNL